MEGINKEMIETLKQHRFHYGYVYVDPDLSNSDEEISAIDFWTDPLGKLSEGEYLFASKIAENHGVSLIQQDFSKRDQKPIYMPVFRTTCKNIPEMKQRTQNLDLAERELKIRIRMYADFVMNKEIAMKN
jgi:hypothetical protein